jgi:LPXTG-motif cell wall-anchored protein
VVNGTGSGSYETGTAVPVVAGTAPTGQRFVGWTITSGGGSFADASAISTTFTMPAGAATVTANYASTDASLNSVADQIIVTGGGDGTIGDPLSAEIYVPIGKDRIGRADIMVSPKASFGLYAESDFTQEVTGTGSIPIVEGSDTTVYVKVTAEDETKRYYSVDVVSPINYSVIRHFGTWTGDGASESPSSAPIEKFEKLLSLPDEQVVDTRYYTASDGSTVITLSEAYLDTLSNGIYVYRAIFTDGYSDLILVVDVRSGGSGDGSGSGSGTTPPSTGDGNAILFISAAVVFLLGSAFVLFKSRRRRAREGEVTTGRHWR